MLFSVVLISTLSAQEKIDVDSIHEGSEKDRTTIGDMFLKAALKYIGVPFVWGGRMRGLKSDEILEHYLKLCVYLKEKDGVIDTRNLI